MKKTYETPVLTTAPFDVDDAITASAPGADTGRLGTAGANWEVSGIPSADVQFH